MPNLFSSEQGWATCAACWKQTAFLELRARKIATEVVSKIDPKEIVAEGAHLPFRDLNDTPREIELGCYTSGRSHSELNTSMSTFRWSSQSSASIGPELRGSRLRCRDSGR